MNIIDKQLRQQWGHKWYEIMLTYLWTILSRTYCVIILKKTGLLTLVWFHFINDIFFVWTGSKDLLNHFISFTQNYSKSKHMKSKIKFEIHLSTNEVHFLDMTVSLNYGKLRTTLFTKPIDSYFFVNNSSRHPLHALKSKPEGQFIHN